MPAAARGRRSAKWVALGVIAICLGGLGSYVLYAQVADQHAVVAVRQAVVRGSVITADDLTVVSVGSVAGVATVPADRLGSVVGRRTSVDLTVGSLLPPGVTTDEPLPGPGRALVGLRLADGRAPHDHLIAGSTVRVLSLASADATTRTASDRSTSTELSVVGRVVTLTPLADGQSVLLDVDVAADQAADVARLASADRIVVVRDSDG